VSVFKDLAPSRAGFFAFKQFHTEPPVSATSVAFVHTDSKNTKIDIAKFDTNLKKEFDKLKSS
jgi:hypothetical protein